TADVQARIVLWMARSGRRRWGPRRNRAVAPRDGKRARCCRSSGIYRKEIVMSSERSYDVIQPEGGVPIKAWTRGVPIEEAAARQLANVARLPFIHRWVAAMPDVHWGIGATVGSVIPTVGAIIPAAVGVDIGCGMMAVETTLTANDLPQSLREVRAAIEAAVPHGRTPRGRDKGSWGTPPPAAVLAWAGLKPGFDAIVTRHPAVGHSNHQTHLG